MARSSNNASTFYYFFDYVYPNHTEDGAFHGAELPFVLNYSTLGPDIPTYWTNFAKTGDPNGEKSDSTWLPNWPSFEEGSDSWQVLGSEISNEPIPESMREIYELAAPLYPPGILGSVGPIYGTNSTGWILEDGVPAA
mmetsp:Transcript_9586/g.33092  ORF Transcript_9586/g.33092 Transcript_9586/m.33092 type:complete len:138 (-) Transcript_9586:1231-1644(-)